jgi:hypothetical protein
MSLGAGSPLETARKGSANCEQERAVADVVARPIAGLVTGATIASVPTQAPRRHEPKRKTIVG